MAIYRTRGLYALNQPSRYVGQSEDFRDWLHTAPEEDVALCERASEFEEHFADMLFDSSVIDNADECTEDGESFDFQPEELHDFTLSWVRFSVAPLDNGAHGAFIDGYNTPIQIWPTAETGYPDGLREYIGNPESYQCAYVIISPEYANDDSVLLHEMIHVYETVLDDFPTFYRDILLWQLYKRMSRKISDLDQRIQAFTHLSDQQKLDAIGGCHDVLFLLKSFDLDIKMRYPLGSVLGYAIPGFPCNVLIEDEKPEE